MTQIDSTTSAPADAPATDGPTRRQVLLTSGAVVAAAAVTAACGSSGSTSPADAASSAGSAASSAASEAAAAATADVPVGGGVILQGRKVVITQPVAGEFKAFTAVCTHQGCLVSSVSDGKINCACHGSVFSAADGSVEAGPATAPLAAVNVSVSGDQITIA